MLQKGTYCAQEQWKFRQREVLTKEPKKALGRTSCTLWSHLSHGRMVALLHCSFGVGFTLTARVLCLLSCSALLWPWTETVRSPLKRQGWNCTQHRHSPGRWSGSRARDSTSAWENKPKGIWLGQWRLDKPSPEASAMPRE